MGWFDEQIKQRIKNDDEMFEAAFLGMAQVVLGGGYFELPEGADGLGALEKILAYFRMKPAEIPADVTDFEDRLEYTFRPSGIMRRTVRLTGDWYKNAFGPMLVQAEDGEIIAAIPRGANGYFYTDAQTGKKTIITAKPAEKLGETAICFYKPLPLKELGTVDLLKFIFGTIRAGDVALLAFATLCVTLLGLVGPYVNRLLFSVVVPGQSLQLLLPIAALLIGATLSSTLLSVFNRLVNSRISTKMGIAASAAAMMRVLSLPAGFFKKYSAGELNARMMSVGSVCGMISNAIFSTGFTSLFSLIYIVQIFNFTPSMAVPALVIIAITVLFSLVSILAQMRLSKKSMEAASKESGLVFSLISGVQKIKLAGAEKRVFANWAQSYAVSAKYIFRPPWYMRINATITGAISMFGTLALYWAAAGSGVNIADYMAFFASYGMVMGAFMSLASIFTTIASIKPSLDLADPILKAVPEVAKNRKTITRLMGGIEIDNVTFGYGEDAPKVLDGLSLKVRSGQYIALVGRTGCGKSTLVRLLLGFEKPDLGAVYFDGTDINTVDLRSLRRKIGTVMQDGKLFEGDVFTNITICAPQATMDDAWEAAQIAGIDEDIHDMPMGMHTIISEGGGGVSGGQRQRLMIARAVAPRPRILIFDEATSALDNITQRKVSDALENLKCTRIVVAHRLSTIKNCDRIIVLDQGGVAEDGTFEELMENKGMFYELAKRQIAEEV